MDVDYSSLHKVLKDPTRRTILQLLSSHGATSYLELMNMTGVTNTGRFNYHIKMLGDFVAKDIDGKYVLTEKGKLAIQFLEQFPAKPSNTERAKLLFAYSAHKPKIPKKIMALSILILVIGVSLFIAIPIATTSFETPSVQWQQFLPGVSGNAVIQTSDGGFLALGINASVINTDSGPTFTNQTPILVKTDSVGNIVWQGTFQINGFFPLAQSILQAIDGGFALIGSGITPQNNAVGYLIKIDSNDNTEWNSSFPFYISAAPFFNGELAGAGNLNSFIQTSSGDYAIVGTYYVGSGPSVPEIYFVKTNSTGNIIVNKTISGGDAISILPTKDNGYVIVSEFPERGGGSMYGLIKTDIDGNVQSTKGYIGPSSVSAYADCGIATEDGGYMIGGYTISNTENQELGWLIRTDSEGNEVWNVTYPDNMDITSIAPSNDGFVLLATNSNTDLNFYSNTQTATKIINIDSQGSIRSQLSIAMGHYLTHPTSLIEAKGGGYVFVGTWHESYQATISQSFWMVKTANIQSVASYFPILLQIAVVITVGVSEVTIMLYYVKRMMSK
jgi:hypothetical protein